MHGLGLASGNPIMQDMLFVHLVRWMEARAGTLAEQSEMSASIAAGAARNESEWPGTSIVGIARRSNSAPG